MCSYTSFDGLNLHYLDEGDGLPLICLAGLTRNASDFDYLAPHLNGVRLIRPDYRGRGASDWSPDFLTYSIPTEARDVIGLMDHLGLEKAAVLGTSRGGLISMVLAATAKDRLIGVCLNDIGPVIDQSGLDVIMDYIGRNPRFATQEQMAAAMPGGMPGFANVPASRWLEEVQRHTVQTPDGLRINYDPRLRDAVIAAGAQPTPDLWPLFDALEGLPVTLIRGANSNLLSPETTAEMRHRRPDMFFAEVPDRGHIPYLDEVPALDAIAAFLKACR